jgi:hypothetical protein
MTRDRCHYALVQGDDPRSLRRVIAAAQSLDVDTGGTVFVTAVEVWDTQVVVHIVENLPEFLPPGEPINPKRPAWQLTDDVGTIYVPGGGGGGASHSQLRSTSYFRGTVPKEARTLRIVGRGMSAGQQIVVDLA